MSKTRVFIYGSCVSRDTFEHLDPNHFELVEYVARQSALSATTRPVETLAPPVLESRFQQRMIAGDFQSSLRPLLAQRANDIDVLLLDLTDERLGVYLLPDGTVVTRSVELIESGAEQTLPPGAHYVAFGTQQHYEYWSGAVRALGDSIRQTVPRAAVVLLDIPWAEWSESGQQTPDSFGVGAAQANPVFRSYVEVAAQALGAHVISLDPSEVMSGPHHPWGDAPFHYAEKVYLDVVRRLTGAEGRVVWGPEAAPRNSSSRADVSSPASGTSRQAPPERAPAPASTGTERPGPDLDKKLVANQVAAIHATMRNALPGKWRKHWLWTTGPASVHEFDLEGSILAFDLSVQDDVCDVQFFPRDKSRFGTFMERVESLGIEFHEVPGKQDRISLGREPIPGGVVNDAFIRQVRSRMNAARETFENAPTEHTVNGYTTLIRRATYDHSQFGAVFGANDGTVTLRDVRRDGVYRLGTESHPIDILVSGFQNLEQHSDVLVVLGGLVGNRSKLTGPFFSGVQTAQVTGMTTVSISDPTLALNNEVPLGWYLGHKYRSEVPAELALLLDELAATWGRRIFFIGGSGGGFAALNIARHMTNRTAGLILNPQTSVSRYSLKHVSTYLSAAGGTPTTVETAEAAHEMLSELGLSHDLTSSSWTGHQFVIAQNATDWHLEAHLKPLMANGMWAPFNDRIHTDPSRGLTTYVRQWGDGHANFPDPNTFANLIRAGGVHLGPVDLALQLDSMIDAQLTDGRMAMR